MKMYAAAAAALRDQGVDTMFGVMGDANMYIVDSFVHESGGKFLSAAHEGGGVLMAAGYAAVTGKVGAATTTHGAITNSVSALFDAVRGRHPVVLVVGDTAAGDDYNLQNLPHRDIVVPTGARFVDVRSAQTVVRDVARAVRLARIERTAVVLNIPIDLQRQDVEYEAVDPGAAPSPVWTPQPAAVEDAIGLISAARRPVVLGGHGVTSRAARDTIVRLAERIGAPLATTLRGKDLFRDEAFNLGICGSLAVPLTSETVARADCLVAFGASLSALTGDFGDLYAGKRIVQVDSDPTAIGRFYPVDVGVVGDVGEAATAMLALWEHAGLQPAGYRSDTLRAELAAYSPADFRHRNPPGTIDLRDALIRIDEIVDRDRTLVVDAGRFLHEALRIVHAPEPSAYVHCLNVSQIGMSVGYGIGAAAGAPHRPTLVVAGDGGFMLGGLAEFNTAVRHRLDLIVCVMNDGAYGAEYYRFAGDGADPSLTTFDWPDLAPVAASLGGIGVTVRTDEDFALMAKALAERDRPVLVDVKLDAATIPEPGRH